MCDIDKIMNGTRERRHLLPLHIIYKYVIVDIKNR